MQLDGRSESLMQTKPNLVAALGVAALALGSLLNAQQPAPGGSQAAAKDPVATLKQSLQEGLAKARQYEWVQTTAISMKGEEKSRKMERCYYGADGKVQKVPIDDGKASSATQGGGGGRGGRGGRVKKQIVENKKEDIAEYMQKAAALVQKYVPPNPDQIQAAKDAGRVSVNPQTGGAVKVAIAQYLQPGDTLTIGLDPAASRLLGLNVDTFLDKPEDKVTLDVQMNTLPDGAVYAGQTTLDAKA